ncbi:MAG TPA: hypothetical protein VMQ56_15835, partial [Terracidiphilus sp.]|nr:hypothetical protein [Terracidiphilus sp.]
GHRPRLTRNPPRPDRGRIPDAGDRPNLPQNRTANCRESLTAALALAEDLLKQHRMAAAAVLGRKGGSTTARRLGAEHYRKMAAARKSHGGGRPRKQAD